MSAKGADIPIWGGLSLNPGSLMCTPVFYIRHCQNLAYCWPSEDSYTLEQGLMAKQVHPNATGHKERMHLMPMAPATYLVLLSSPLHFSPFFFHASLPFSPIPHSRNSNYTWGLTEHIQLSQPLIPLGFLDKHHLGPCRPPLGECAMVEEIPRAGA